MTLTIHTPMTLEEYLEYDDSSDARYELEAGVLVEMGSESPINSTIAMFLVNCFLQLGIAYYQIAIGHQIAVNSTQATARQPDLIVHTEASATAILSGTRLLLSEMPAPALVVEIVSSSDTDKKSRDRDYHDKRHEYAERGIPEYWIIDPAAAVVLVLNLSGQAYQEHAFREQQQLISATFPALTLTAAQILSAGLPAMGT